MSCKRVAWGARRGRLGIALQCGCVSLAVRPQLVMLAAALCSVGGFKEKGGDSSVYWVAATMGGVVLACVGRKATCGLWFALHSPLHGCAWHVTRVACQSVWRDQRRCKPSKLESGPAVFGSLHACWEEARLEGLMRSSPEPFLSQHIKHAL